MTTPTRTPPSTPQPRSPQPDQPYVTVSIYDQAYHLSGEDISQVQQLAARVDARMRAVASHGRTADSLRVAVLAALNLADELARAEQRLRVLEDSREVTESDNLRIRAANLRGLLDSVLDDEA